MSFPYTITYLPYVFHPLGEEEIHHSDSVRKKVAIKVSDVDPTVLLDMIGRYGESVVI